jgi:hypothetical protein
MMYGGPATPLLNTVTSWLLKDGFAPSCQTLLAKNVPPPTVHKFLQLHKVRRCTDSPVAVPDWGIYVVDYGIGLSYQPARQAT